MQAGRSPGLPGQSGTELGWDLASPPSRLSESLIGDDDAFEDPYADASTTPLIELEQPPPARDTAGGRSGQPPRQPDDEALRDALRAAVTPVYTPSTLFGLADGVVLPVIPLLARSLGASHRVVGTVASARATGKLLGDIPAGVSFSKVGPRRSMLIGLGGVACTAAIAAMSRVTWLLWAVLVVSGVCEGFFSVSSAAFAPTRGAGVPPGRWLDDG